MVAKTNFGHQWHKQKQSHNTGYPNIDKEKTIIGTVIDIAYPSGGPAGEGVQVKIVFDNRGYIDKWFTLKDSYEYCLATIGNGDAVRSLKPRVQYTYKNIDYLNGIASIICDNTQEEKYKQYEKSKSNNIGGSLSALSRNYKPPGFK